MVTKIKLENKAVRFGLLGAGRIAQTYAEVFQSTRFAKLVAVTDIRPAAAAALAESFKVVAVPSADHLLSDAEIDAVVIATPPASHCELSLKFLQHGISVLCEKPVSISAADAWVIRETARSKSALFTMASKFRYVEDVIRAKSIVASGILGELILYENTFASRVDMSSRWNSDPSIGGGGVLIDNGTHSLDLMRYFLGTLEEIHVTEALRTQGLAVEETIQMLVRSRSGVLGTADLSWTVSKANDYYIKVYGSQGTLKVGWKESSFQQEGSRNWVSFGNGYDKVKAFQHQLDNFASAICGTEKLLITADDAVASAEAVEAGYAALRERRWCNINAAAKPLAAAV